MNHLENMSTDNNEDYKLEGDDLEEIEGWEGNEKAWDIDSKEDTEGSEGTGDIYGFEKREPTECRQSYAQKNDSFFDNAGSAAEIGSKNINISELLENTLESKKQIMRIWTQNSEYVCNFVVSKLFSSRIQSDTCFQAHVHILLPRLLSLYTIENHEGHEVAPLVELLAVVSLFGNLECLLHVCFIVR